MNQKVLEKMAQQDAEEWGLAEMFFGEGAGTRRKLVGAKVSQRAVDIPGYAEAFDEALAKVNQIEMAEKALSLRRRLDRGSSVKKNLNAIKSGKLQNLSTSVFVVGGLIYVAHTTGYDKKIEAKAKKLYKDLKSDAKYYKAKLQGKNVEKLY